MKKKSLIIVSGGVDSITLLYEKAKEIALAVSFDYQGNLNKEELKYAKYHCEKLGIKHTIIELPFIKKLFSSALLKNANKIQDYHNERKVIKESYVPFRNGIFLSIACGIAESYELDTLLIASHFGVVESMPDCTQQFIEKMNQTMQVGTWQKISVNAPYTNLLKSTIVEIGGKMGIDYSMTYSCYKGGHKHCGVCKACIERKEAFLNAGIIDPTEYEN